jgi:hypothetical protein
MSRVRTKLKKLGTLEKTMKELGFRVQTGKVFVSGYYNSNEEACDLVANCDRNRSGRDRIIGFKKQGDVYEMVGDEYGTGLNFEHELESITMKYAETEVKAQFAENPDLMDFSLVTRKENENGDIELLFERF